MEVKNQISNHFGFEHLPQATQSGLVCVLASLKRNEKRSQYFQYVLFIFLAMLAGLITRKAPYKCTFIVMTRIKCLKGMY